MPNKTLNRIIATGVFLSSFIVYMLTLSRTVVFWDVGEYLSSAYLLQVPHPPGAPLLLLVGHIFSLIPFSTDPAFRMHIVSALSGSIVVMLLYLISVKVFRYIRGIPETVIDAIILYGSSVIGALSLAFIYSFWNNSIEFEAKGTAMFFVALIFWLILQWKEQADQPHNEKYLLLIAYLVGLCIGVRPLAVLMILPVGLVIYNTNYKFQFRSFILFSMGAVAALGAVYPGIVQYIPSLFHGEFLGVQSDILKFIPVILILAAGYGVYAGLKTKSTRLHLVCLTFLLVMLGYTTYFEVYIRSNVDNLPMNENRPNNISNFVSYVSREQYGDTPLLKGESWDNQQQNYVEKLFPRRWSREPMHQPTRENYTDDADFFWHYQVNHMYLRYLLRNYIGADGYIQDDGVNASSTYAIPFLLGLVGLVYQFRKDWRMGLVFFSAFMMMGIVFALYQNQQDPQPRERDYFYAGSYFVFSLWIGTGVLAIIDFLRKFLTKASLYNISAVGLLSCAFIAVPVNLVRMNWHTHDRSKNYIAWDYSYNILQSCEKNAIIFTNGDNDTFPLWYLQDVEGIRQDIRIVNLSLVNTPWYIYQLRNETPHGAPKVPMNITNEEIERIEPRAWRPAKVELPVPATVLERFIANDKPQVPNWSLDTSLQSLNKITFTIDGVPYDNTMRFLRVQDIITWEIIRANNWERPIYFASTCSPDSKLGLDDYLWLQGLAMKLKPFKVPSQELALDAAKMESNLMHDIDSPGKTPMSGFRWRNLNDTSVYYDDNVQRMAMNYRASFLRLYEYNMTINPDREKGKQILRRMEQLMPVSVIPNLDWRYTAHFMNQFNTLGDTENFNKYSVLAEKKCLELIAANDLQSQDFNPYQILTTIYETRKNWTQALNIAQQWKATMDAFGNDPRYASDRNYQAQVAYLNQMIARYQEAMKH